MIKPLPGYVLVEPLEEEEMSAGGIYTPESTKDKPSKGKVVAQGETEEYRLYDKGKIYHLNLINKTVVYKKWTNQEVQYEGKEYLLVKFDELLAVIE